MKCIDEDGINVFGDYNSPKARQFVLLFEKCDNSTYEGVCKSEEQINSWVRRKFVLIAHNDMRFSTRDFNDKTKVAKELRLEWIQINTQQREEQVYKVQLTDLSLQDTYY